MKNETRVYVGMDVHKDSVMIAVLPEEEREPTLVKRLSHDPRGSRRLLECLAPGSMRFAPAMRGAGRYVQLERMIRSWGHACEIVAPSLIPRWPGERRKHDRKDRRGAREALPGGGTGDEPGRRSPLEMCSARVYEYFLSQFAVPRVSETASATPRATS